MKPGFRLIAQGTDITAMIADRLLSITSTDEAGFKSDRLSIKLDNRKHEIELPAKGAKLELALGYGSELSNIGSFIVDEVASSGPPASLTIKAKAADMLEGLKARKTRSWGGDTIGDIVAAIARDHGLTPRVSAELASIAAAPLPYAQIDQNNESDLHFLTRLARQYDAVAKPVFGYLIFVPRGEAKAASGAKIRPVTLSEDAVTRWSARAPDRGKYKAVKAYWNDTQSGSRKHTTAGEGEPVFSLRHAYGSAEEAEAAASAKLAALERGEATMTLSLPGNASLAAEGRVSFETRDALARGQWVITRAEHELTGGSGGGYFTRLDLETPKDKS
jgi:phage protein D